MMRVAQRAVPQLTSLVHLASGSHMFATSHIGMSSPSPSKLDEVVKLDTLLHKSPAEVEEIWMRFHLDETKQRAGAVIQRQIWDTISFRARSAPNFVLPLAKGGGKSLTVLLQCQLPFALFTQLEDFKQLGPSAPPAACVTHYTELADSHGLILSRADVLQPHITSVPEARTLMALLHVFYSNPDSFLHVHRFNHEPDSFDYESLLKQLGHPTTT